jgi:16S rRNA (cytosine967-C5)-methyltransferase
MPAAPSPAGRDRVAPARRCAYAVLRRVFEDGAYAERALQAQARGLATRDRALAMRLAYGSVQRRLTLDHAIEELAGRPAGRLDPPLLAALRLGAYELAYTDGAPDHAVVADCVELAKLNARAGHGLVNAVLRRAAREDLRGRLAGLPDATLSEASLAHSHPPWIAALLWEALGPAGARAMMAADNEAPELAVRANTLFGPAAELARELPVPSRPDPLLPEALVLEGPLDMHASPLWAAGAFTAQSRAAMLVSHVLAPEPGERVLDLCAAPGGKTTHLAALARGGAEIVAVERNPRRAEALARTVERMRAPGVRVEVADAAAPRSDGPPFDRVLVDAPCSGLGTLAANPDQRWRIREQALAEMAAQQARILRAAADALRPGGVLVYSTCTISPTENEHAIAALLDSRPDLSIDDPADVAAQLAWRPPELPGGVLLTLPHRDRTAGFFIARLRRS